jgi:hypothetical protein
VLSFHNKDKYFVRHACRMTSFILLQVVFTFTMLRQPFTDLICVCPCIVDICGEEKPIRCDLIHLIDI